MRIAVFVKGTTHHKVFGGLETQNKSLCEGLAKRGYQVIVITPKKEVSCAEINENGVKYYFVEASMQFSVIEALNPKNWYTQSYKLFSQLNKEKKFDLVISQSSAGLGAIRNRAEFYAPILSISHGSIVGEYLTAVGSLKSIKSYAKLIPDTLYMLRVFFGRQREFIHGSALVIAVSNFVKKSIVEETFIDGSRVLVIQNGVDYKNYSGRVRQTDTKGVIRFAYVGRVLKSKGIFLAVEALSNLESAVLNIYGDGADLETLKKFVSKLKMEDRIFIHGKVPYSEIASKLYENDVFILPSLRYEGFPMTLVEAMLAGMPVIASDIGGISDAVLDGTTGFLLKSGDKMALIDSMQKLESSSELRQKFGNAGRERALSNFTLDKMLDSYEKVFNSLMNRK